MANKNKQQNEDPFKDLVDLNDLAGRLRKQNSKCHLIFAHNGTGKHAYQWHLKIWGNKTIAVIRCILMLLPKTCFLGQRFGQ